MRKTPIQTMRASLLSLLLLLVSALTTTLAYADTNEDLGRMQSFIELMDGYYGVIESVQAISADPDKSAILQLQKIEEFYKNRGDRAEAISVMRDVLKRAKSPTVRNATAVMLADALNETGKTSEGINVLKEALNENLAR